MMFYVTFRQPLQLSLYQKCICLNFPNDQALTTEGFRRAGSLRIYTAQALFPLVNVLPIKSIFAAIEKENNWLVQVR